MNFVASPKPGSPTHVARRLSVRRARWICGLIFVLGCVVLLAVWGREASVVEDIWDDEEEGVREQGGAGWKSPFGQSRPGSGGTAKGGGAEQAPFDYIAPMHPDLSLLPSPNTIFSEVRLPGYLKPPTYDPFPDGQLRDIISPYPTELATQNPYSIPDNAFSRQWEVPPVWDQPRGDIRPVQWEGFAGKRNTWETPEEKGVREQRRDAVKRAFVWAWQAYKDHAWGNDEIKPVSQTSSNPFNSWGASIVDTLDTLLIMGLSDEYNMCRPFVNQLNFHWVSGRDWAHGYTNPDSVDEHGEPNEPWKAYRDRAVALPVFETSIRYLGGLLGAYDLSGDTLLLDRAVDLANVLGKAFNTDSGLPARRIDPGMQGGYRIGRVSLAEVGSMSLEFFRLSQVTGNRTWHDLVQRAMDYIEVRVIPRGSHQPLIPMWFQPDGGLKAPMNGAISLGGFADSYYEYLIKAYKLLGGSDAAQQYRKLYEWSVETIKELLFVDVDFIPNRYLLALGRFEQGILIPEIEHLSCFAGGMLGLGSRLLDRQQDMVDAQRFTQTCYWLSAATPTGLQPEVVEFFRPGDDMWEKVTVMENGERVLPEDDVGSKSTKVVERLRGSPPGSRKVAGRGINRPENIESIYYMYRLTGDRKWQEKGWKMFVSWVTSAKVDGGFSSIADVTKKDHTFSDNMESFVFAETFKYHFLLQSEPDFLSLDDYVLNTEAHPMLSNPELKPGSSQLWQRPADLKKNLGVPGQGTDAQKWARLNVLNRSRPQTAEKYFPGGKGGGGGMGGGGGDPHHRPKAPW